MIVADHLSRRGFLTHVVLGALAVTAIILGFSMWTFAGASSAASRATDKVSEFYLHELAGHRSQVISGMISERFDEMRRAVSFMEPSDLTSKESLRQFIGEVEDLLDVKLFAFADEQNTVYASHVTYSGGSRYDFLSEEDMDEQGTISSTTMYGASQQVCLALPVTGVTFQGHTLDTCFIQIDVDHILSSLAFGSELTNTTFSLYHRNGQNLTGHDFGPFDNLANIIAEMRGLVGDDVASGIERDFGEQRQGGVDFSVGDEILSLYYAPIGRTDWMLTVLVSDNVIKSQIHGITEDMLSRSTLQILVTAAALIVYFGSLIIRAQRLSAQLIEVERNKSKVAGERVAKSEQELTEVKGIAYSDSLTGVSNKNAFNELVRQIDDAIDHGVQGELAVVVCDVNGLKETNDNLGHTAGDELLKNAAALIGECFPDATVYRYGGDEFCVIVEGSALEHLDGDFQTMQRRVEANLYGRGVVVACGMSRLEEGDRTLQGCFERADRSMYIRKQQLKDMGAATRS